MPSRLRTLLVLLLAALPVVPAGAAAPTAPRAVPGAAAHHPKSALPWIEDDYPGALAKAKQRKVPLFVESWAPW